MKKVVVVVNDERVYFEGDNLRIINKPSEFSVAQTYVGPEILIVKNQNEEIGVFRKWDFWQKIA